MACDTNYFNDSLLLHLDTGFGDSSQNALTVTGVNGASIVSTPTPMFGAGCLDVLGTAYIKTPVTIGPGQLEFTDFTVEGWFNTAGNTGVIRTIFSTNSDPGITGFRLTLDNSSTSAALSFEPLSEGTGWTRFYSGFSTSSGVWADSNWHAFALVRTGDSMTIYVDGINVGSVPSLATACGVVAPVPMPASTTMTFGYDGLAAQSNYFNGYLDEIRVSNFARYTANYTPAATPFSNAACLPSCDPYWSNVVLLIPGNSTAGSGTFVDISPIGNTVTNSGTTVATASNPQFGTTTVEVGTVALTVPITSGGPLDLANVPNWTIECWIFQGATSGGSFPISAGQYFFAPGSPPAPGSGFFVEALGTGASNQYWTYGDGHIYTAAAGVGVALNAGGNWSIGQWTHVAIVNNGNSVTTYCNGVGTGGTVTIPSSGQPSWSSGGQGVFAMGGYPSAPSVFPGQVANMRVTRGVARYTSNFSPASVLPTYFGLSCATNVPNVVGQSDAIAQATLTGAGFTVGMITDAANAAAPTVVIAQSPLGGTGVSLPTTVNLTESLGLTIPDLTNQSIPVAIATLTAADFVLGTQTIVPNGIVLAGNIISQTPVSGTQAAGGTAVNVVVSGGLPPPTIPDLFELTAAEAIVLLESLGLTVGAISSAPSNLVGVAQIQAQNPSAGAVVAIGTTVSFVLSTGVPAVGTIFDFEATVISQYANSPTMMQLCANLNQYIDQSANFAAFYNYVWNVLSATGFGLDIWGTIVNVSRLLQIPNTTDYVGFYMPSESQPDQDWQPMGSDQDNPPVGGALYTGNNATESYLLPDNAYRQLILAKAFANICKTTAPAMNQILQNLYGVGTAFVLNTGVMTISYNLTFTPTAIQLAILQQSGVIPTPPGVAFTINTGV